MEKTREFGKKVWDVVCDILEFLGMVFKVGFSGTAKKFNTKAKCVCGFIATTLTFIVTKVLLNTWVGAGLQYGIASIQKRLAIWWASEGDWSHWMTGGRYSFFKVFKEELIASNGFARFLNNLAGNGVMAKLLQIFLILVCLVIVMVLIFMMIQGIYTFGVNLKKIIKKKQHQRAHQVKRA